MARRQQLSETQLAELFDPLTEPRELVRHYTLPAKDLAAAQRCRGDHNRLGYALMLCCVGAIQGQPLRSNTTDLDTRQWEPVKDDCPPC